MSPPTLCISPELAPPLKVESTASHHPRTFSQEAQLAWELDAPSHMKIIHAFALTNKAAVSKLLIREHQALSRGKEKGKKGRKARWVSSGGRKT